MVEMQSLSCAHNDMRNKNNKQIHHGHMVIFSVVFTISQDVTALPK